LLASCAFGVVLARPPVGEAPFPDQHPSFDLQRADIQRWIRDVSARHGFSIRELDALLADAEPQPRIIELISRPAERVLPWWRYRANFLTEQRIAAGAAFWAEHRAALAAAERRTGVPAAYIVAIIGVETYYGRITGNHRVLDALMTLAFDYPPRAAFFRGELEQLLLLAREEGLDAARLRGSYAGAIGPPQFIPSSYRRYAVDGDGDGRRDLLANWADIIASVANYFSVHGWRGDEPVLTDAAADAALIAQLDVRNLELNETVGSLRGKGVSFSTDRPDSTPVMLVPAELESGPNVRVGFNNFRVITRYNRSVRYAMAVHDLAISIGARMARHG
ncbi:MAG: lytic murein transglycosylase B, partial [Gammaproteobacteria bacterium]|nr:lytic murein transglycosylase B [Gammaproteobacteria bacterium]